MVRKPSGSAEEKKKERSFDGRKRKDQGTIGGKTIGNVSTWIINRRMVTRQQQRQIRKLKRK